MAQRQVLLTAQPRSMPDFAVQSASNCASCRSPARNRRTQSSAAAESGSSRVSYGSYPSFPARRRGLGIEERRRIHDIGLQDFQFEVFRVTVASGTAAQESDGHVAGFNA